MPRVDDKLRNVKPDIEKKEHDVGPEKEEDVIVKMGHFRIYFQNYYTLISLINDIFTGVLYLTGSLTQTFTDFETAGSYMFIFASFFLLMRPILKILHNVFLYREEEYQEKVLGENTEEAVKRSEGESDKPTKEVDLRSESKKEEAEEKKEKKEKEENKNDEGNTTKSSENNEESEPKEEIEKGYNDSFYQSEEKE